MEVTCNARPGHTENMVPQSHIVEDIMTDVEKVLQSEEELKLDNQFEIHVGILRIPRGAGGRGKYFVNNRQMITNKRSIVEIVNDDDNLCFDRAVAVSLAKLDKDSSSSNDKKRIYQCMCNKKKNNQYKEALKLRNLVGLPLDHSITVRDCKLYENKLDVRIILIDSQESQEIKTKTA